MSRAKSPAAAMAAARVMAGERKATVSRDTGVSRSTIDRHLAALKAQQITQVPQDNAVPVRTHKQDMGRAERRGGDTSGLRKGPRKLTGRGRGGLNARRVLCDGVEYPNTRAACKGLGIGFNRFYDWIETGRARYVGVTAVPVPA